MKHFKIFIACVLISISAFSQVKWTVKNYNYVPYNGIRIDSVLTLPDTTFSYAPNGSIAFMNHSLYFKDTTWKVIASGGPGLSYVNGWGLGLSGNSFRVDTSLVPTIWYADNRFYTKSQINAFFSGVTPISGYNKSNWDAVYSAYAAVQALSPAGWATQSALIDTANQLRAAIGSGGGGSGDMTKAVYDANNNGIVDVLELTGVVIGNNTSVPTAISGAANQLLRRNAGNTAYEFFTPTYQAALSGTGLVKSTGGTISYISDFSNDWNTAYSWGNHALAGYLTSVDTSNIGSFWQKVRSLFNGTSPIAYSNGNISLDTSAGKWRSENYYDTKFVHLTGNETIAGNKTFTSTIDWRNTAVSNPLLSITGTLSTNWVGTVQFASNANSNVGNLRFGTTGLSANRTWILPDGNTLDTLATQAWARANITGGGGGSGTVNSGNQYRIAYYAGTGTAVSEAPAITASRVLVSDANGVPTHSTVTTTTLGYLDATSSVQTQLNNKASIDSLRNRYISVRAINDTSWAYRKWNGSGYTEDTLVISLANGDKGDITVNSGWSNWTIDNGAVTNAKVATGIDAAKIADGSVSNTEYQRLDGVTSGIQAQIDGKQGNIQYKDEGTNLGSPGTNTAINFTGAGVTATTSSGTVTVNIPGGGSGGSGLTAGFYKTLKFTIDSTTGGPTAGKDSVDLSAIVSTGMHLEYDREYAWSHDSVSYWWNPTTRVLKVSPAWYNKEHNYLVFTPDSLWTSLSFPAPAGYDTDAQAYFTAEETASSTTLSTTFKNAVNDAIVSLKSNGLWTKTKIFNPLMGTGLLNAKNPLNTDAAFRRSLVGSSDPVLSSAGWAYNGNDAFNTHLVPSTNLATGNEAFAIGVKNFTSGYVMGGYVSGSCNYFSPKDGSNINYRLQKSGDVNGGANASPDALYIGSVKNDGTAIRRRAEKNGTLFQNVDGSIGVDVDGAATVVQYVGAFYNDASGLAALPATFTETVFWYGDGLSDTERANLRTILQAFLTATSRN